MRENMTELTQSAQKRTLHFDALDGLRGVAAFMVLLGHASSEMFGGGHHTWAPRKGLAVVFFFALSGFVVAYAYESRILRGMTFREFALRRIVRLFPMIILGAALASLFDAVFMVGYWPHAKGLLASAFSALCLPGARLPFANWTRFPTNPPEWSLFFELIAYVLFAFILARATTRTLAVIVAVAFAGYIWVDVHFADSWPAPPLWSFIFETVASFGAGMLLWRARDKWFAKVPAAPFWMLGLPIVLICLSPLRWGVFPDAFAFLIVFPVVLAVGAARGRHQATAVERVLGDLSFPVYIIHWPFLKLAHLVVKPEFGPFIAMCAGMAAAIGAAWIAIKVYDQPIRKRLVDRFFGSRTNPKSASINIARPEIASP